MIDAFKFIFTNACVKLSLKRILPLIVFLGLDKDTLLSIETNHAFTLTRCCIRTLLRDLLVPDVFNPLKSQMLCFFKWMPKMLLYLLHKLILLPKLNLSVITLQRRIKRDIAIQLRLIIGGS